MSSFIAARGNLTRDPDGGFAAETGKAWAHLDLAVNDRVKTTSGQWANGPAFYYRVTVFGRTAEHALESLHRGEGVVFAGQLTVKAYTRTDGTEGVNREVIADLLGMDLSQTKIAAVREPFLPDDPASE